MYLDSIVPNICVNVVYIVSLHIMPSQRGGMLGSLSPLVHARVQAGHLHSMVVTISDYKSPQDQSRTTSELSGRIYILIGE